MKKGYGTETLTMPAKQAYRVIENVEDVKGAGEYLANGWDPAEKQLMAQLDRNNKRIRQAARRGNVALIEQLCEDSDQIIRQWQHGNDREDRQHLEIPQAASVSLGIMYATVEKQEPVRMRA